MDLIGGITSFLKPGDKVLLKPNLLSFHKPEEGVTTHPAVVRAVVQIVQEAGAQVIIADSPGGAIPYTKDSLKKLYEITDITQIATETEAFLNYNTEWESLPHPEGKLIKILDVIKPVLEADCIINLPKLKTHLFTTLTLATKNLFGVVPGLLKVGYHAKIKEVIRFSEMLLDILTFVKPVLTVMDGIVAMEGDGPASGSPYDLGLIIAGADTLCVDSIACGIIGLDPKKLPVVERAVERGDDLWKVRGY